MDWKKIFNAAKLPFGIMLAYYILAIILTFSHLDPVWHDNNVTAVITYGIVLLAGFRGAKNFRLDYLQTAIMGAILSLVQIANITLFAGYLTYVIMPKSLPEFLMQALIASLVFAAICAVLAVIGAFVANTLSGSKKKSKR